MRTTEQINTFWELARERSADGETVRRRIAAIGAMSILVCGFLLAIGLGLLVLVFLAGMAASVAVVALISLWPRLLAGIRPRSRELRARAADGSARTAAGFARLARLARAGSRGARRTAGTGARRAAETGSRLGGNLAQAARGTAIRFAPRPARLEPQREAIRLNATGTQHRRHGRHEEAVDCHRQALEILRALGDRRGVALTQSNLALALSHSAEDDEWAIGLFEEAAATLNELGDEEHAAQVMANLGLVHRRRGRQEEGDNVLELALAKLTPASSAYQAIEEQLRRAS